MSTILKIKNENELLAIVIRNDYSGDGVQFLTPDEYSQQVAYMHHPQGKTIHAHTHNHIERTVVMTQEVLFIKRGKLRADFYTSEHTYLKSCYLYGGDTILLISGGHGFEVLEEVEMIEVKQGPYLGDQDKVVFESVKNQETEIHIEK